MSIIEEVVPLEAETGTDFEEGMSEELVFGRGYVHHTQKPWEETVKGTLLGKNLNACLQCFQHTDTPCTQPHIQVLLAHRSTKPLRFPRCT